MKASGIFNHENSFKQTGIDNDGKGFKLTDTTVSIPGSNKKLTLTDCIRTNKDDTFYFKEVIPKKKIVLHFTMGYLKGDIARLTTNSDHVSVPFVIARNGSIYNLFASKFWSFHLGKGTSGGNTAMSQSSIGIEISNIGPLKKIGNNLVTSYRDDDVYCALSETQYYHEMPQLYRGFKYYASFTNEQYESAIGLVRFLAAKFDIPKQFIPEANRFSLLDAPEFTAFSGIVSHVNCRMDKVDIGAAFDWKRVVDGVIV